MRVEPRAGRLQDILQFLIRPVNFLGVVEQQVPPGCSRNRMVDGPPAEILARGVDVCPLRASASVWMTIDLGQAEIRRFEVAEH